MSLLVRAPLASIVCPTVPFLVPRLLGVPTRLTALYHPCGTFQRPSLQRAAFTTGRDTKTATKRDTKTTTKRDTKTATKRHTKTEKKRPTHKVFFQSEKQKARKEYVDENAKLIDRLQKACETRDVPNIMFLYPSALESSLLQPQHTHRILQALHAYLRNHSRSPDRRTTLLSSLLPFVDRLTDDIRQGRLPPHPLAHVHILGILKEVGHYEEGYRFWKWLAEQDDTVVDQAVYGAALELLAYRGQHSLQELEDIYQDGLKRFPGTFAEYHLSPEAVVPDRSRPITIPGIPIGLLQGILTARILNRDWKRAYLALDTALRLYPTSVPHRFFELFMTERPIAEAYAIFLLACRSGVVFKPNHLTNLSDLLKKKIGGELLSQSERLLMIRAMANALYAYIESGGPLNEPNVGNFFHSFKCLLGPMHAQEPSEADKAVKSSLIFNAFRNMTRTLIQAGYPFPGQLHILTIAIADEFGSEEVLRSALQALHDLGPSNISEVRRRVVLQAIGRLGDEALIAEYWAQIVNSAELQGENISFKDWLALASACRRANNHSFFYSQLSSFAHAIHNVAEAHCSSILRKPTRSPKPLPYTYMPISEMKQGLADIESIINNVAAVLMSGKPLDLKRTPFSMFLDPNHKPMGSESELRKLYDDWTTDPHQPEAPKDPAAKPDNVHRSSTGIPLDELRFQNWVAINEIMNIADAEEKDFEMRINVAIATKAPVVRFALPKFVAPDATAASAPKALEAESKRLADLKARIKRLRTPDAVSSITTAAVRDMGRVRY